MTQKWHPGSHPKVTRKWLKNDSHMGSGSLWGWSAGVTFESLLGHFNSFCVSADFGTRPLHKTRNHIRLYKPQISETQWKGDVWRRILQLNLPPEGRNALQSRRRANGVVCKWGRTDLTGFYFFSSVWVRLIPLKTHDFKGLWPDFNRSLTGF